MTPLSFSVQYLSAMCITFTLPLNKILELFYETVQVFLHKNIISLFPAEKALPYPTAVGTDPAYPPPLQGTSDVYW